MSYAAREPIRPSQADAARTLLETATRGILATIAATDGYPYASVVELAADADGEIILLLSDLAEHTRNLTADDRVSVVVNEHDVHGEVLALGRATYKGRVERLQKKDAVRELYLQKHPSSSKWVDFGDFAFYRIAVEAVRYIGGFGRMSWVDRESWRASSVDPLAEIAHGVIEHMNDDHAHNLLDYTHAFTDADWAERATMVRLDQHGFDLRVENDERSTEVRIGFAEPRTTADEIHEIMVRLAREARR